MRLLKLSTTLLLFLLVSMILTFPTVSAATLLSENFESWPSGWTGASSVATFARSSDKVHGGSYSAFFSSTTTGSYNYTIHSFTAKGAIHYQVWFYVVNTAAYGTMVCQFYDGTSVAFRADLWSNATGFYISNNNGTAGLNPNECFAISHTGWHQIDMYWSATNNQVHYFMDSVYKGNWSQAVDRATQDRIYIGDGSGTGTVQNGQCYYDDMVIDENMTEPVSGTATSITKVDNINIYASDSENKSMKQLKYDNLIIYNQTAASRGVNPVSYNNINLYDTNINNKSLTQEQTDLLNLYSFTIENKTLVFTETDILTFFDSIEKTNGLSLTPTDIINLFETNELSKGLTLTNDDILNIYLDINNLKTMTIESMDTITLQSLVEFIKSMHLTQTELITLLSSIEQNKGLTITKSELINLYLSINNIKKMNINPYDTVTIQGLINLLRSIGIYTWDNINLNDVNAVQKLINAIQKDDFYLTEIPQLQKNMTKIETILYNLNEFKETVRGINLESNDLVSFFTDFGPSRGVYSLFGSLFGIQSFFGGSWNGTNIPLTTPAPTSSGNVNLSLMFGSVFLIIGLLVGVVIIKRRKTNDETK